MKLKKILLIVSIGICFVGVNAQQNTTAAGGDASGAGGTVSYSIGQIDYVVQTGAGGTANQGIQQPYEILTTGGLSETNIQLEAIVFPNPTTSGVVLNIKETDFSTLSYTVYDAQGKLLDKRNIANQQTQVDLKNFSNGNYFISVLKNNKQVKQFKVIKKQ